LKSEFEQARNLLLTERCLPECNHLCGVCSKVTKVADTAEIDTILEDVKQQKKIIPVKVAPSYPAVQVIMTYKRSGRALFISHINAMRNFEMAFQRSGMDLQFTQGYNPKPKLEFVNPLSLGVSGDNEVLLAELMLEPGVDQQMVKERLQDNLNEGYELKKVLFIQLGKKQTLAKFIMGSIYLIDTRNDAVYDPLLRSCIPKSNNDLSVIQKGEYLYEVRIAGEKNLVKTIFGMDANKFEIASKISIKRVSVCAGSWEDDYISFFNKKMKEFKQESDTLLH
ncbi:MAG: TIGR03936 family radical SAM-associated protein, partial [Sphaerochaeta sp.]